MQRSVRGRAGSYAYARYILGPGRPPRRRRCLLEPCAPSTMRNPGRRRPRLIRSRGQRVMPLRSRRPSFDCEQYLLAVLRTPMTTSSEMEVALRSSRTRTTVPSRMSRTIGSSASERAFQRPSRSSPCARPGSPCPCRPRRRTAPPSPGAPGGYWCRPGRCRRSARRQPAYGADRPAVPNSSTPSSCPWGRQPGSGDFNLNPAKGPQQRPGPAPVTIARNCRAFFIASHAASSIAWPCKCGIELASKSALR